MSKIEIGTIVTLVLAIIGGALWLGDLNGRLKAVEGGGAISNIQRITEDSIEKIKSERDKSSFSENISSVSAPIGTIIGFTGEMSKENEENLKRQGWLLCDGRHLSQTEYKELFKRIGRAWGGDISTFNLPDFQGVFLRGVSGKSNRDPDSANRIAIKNGGNTGNKVGSYQEDQFQAHKHKETAHTHEIKALADNREQLAKSNNWWAPGKGETKTEPATCNIKEPEKLSDKFDSPRYGQETRPINVYIYWLIKCK